METKRLATIAASAHNLIRSAGHAGTRWNRMIWLLAIATGFAACHPAVALADFFTFEMVEPFGEGTVSPSVGNYVVADGAVVSIVATPAPCYRFKQWNYDGTVLTMGDPFAASTTVTVHGDGGVRAWFESIPPYMVRVCTPQGGTVAPSPGTHTYDPGSIISIQATPGSCYEFSHWDYSGGVTVADPTAASTMVEVNGHGTLCPVFKKIMYTVQICTPPNGTVVPSPGDHTYCPGSTVSIHAMAATHYKFQRWDSTGGVTVADPTAANTTMTVTGDGTLCPAFEKKITQVPNLAGVSETDVEAALEAAGLDLGTESYGLSNVQAGLVINQDPKAGTTVEEGTEVNVTISQHPSHFCVDTRARGENDGLSWPDAFVHLQDALKVAMAGDEIWVAKGTYRPDEGASAPTGREATFTLGKGVTLYGGFPRGGQTWDRRDPLLNETILSGDIGKAGDPNDNSYHIIVASNTDANTVLDGFTITGGNADGEEAGDYYIYGGAMYNLRGHLSVANCLFTGNAAVRSGAVFNRFSNATFNNCSFIANTCAIDAAGMLCRESNTIVSNCLFAHNAAGRSGGGLFTFLQGTPWIINCRFEVNSAAGNGAGVMNHRSQPTFVGCVFTGNASAGYGGGLYNLDGQEPGYVINCAFSGNTAKNDGGGVCDVNCPHTLVNCILWGNLAKNGPQLAAYTASEVQIGYCCMEGGQEKMLLADDSLVDWGPGNVTTDPLFVDADGADGIVGTEDDRLDLATNSPCLDAGDNKQVPADIADLDGDGNTSERMPLDIAGYPRFVDNTAAANKGIADPPTYPAIVDMGAYEHAR